MNADLDMMSRKSALSNSSNIKDRSGPQSSHILSGDAKESEINNDH